MDYCAPHNSDVVCIWHFPSTSSSSSNFFQSAASNMVNSLASSFKNVRETLLWRNPFRFSTGSQQFHGKDGSQLLWSCPSKLNEILGPLTFHNHHEFQNKLEHTFETAKEKVSPILEKAKELVKYPKKNLWGSKKTSSKYELGFDKHTLFSKVKCGALLCGSAQAIHSIMMNYHKYKIDGDCVAFLQEIGKDTLKGVAIGGGLACIWAISPFLGISSTLAFIFGPSICTILCEGMSSTFFKKIGLSLTGITVGTLLIPFGAIPCGLAIGAATYLFQWLSDDESIKPRWFHSSLGSTCCSYRGYQQTPILLS